MHRHATGQPHRRVITVINRIEHDDFVTRPHHRVHRAEQRFGRAGCDGHLGVGIDAMRIETINLGRHLLPQRRHTSQRRVLVVAMGGVVGEALGQFRRAVVIRITLREIDGAMVSGHLRHNGENGGADFGQFAFKTRRGAHDG